MSLFSSYDPKIASLVVLILDHPANISEILHACNRVRVNILFSVRLKMLQHITSSSVKGGAVRSVEIDSGNSLVKQRKGERGSC